MTRTMSVILLLLVMLTVVYGKRKNTERIWKTKKKNCERDTCSHLPLLESEDCVNKCISRTCYQSWFSEEKGGPLEDGEIDVKRSKGFLACVRGEAKIIHARKVKESKRYKGSKVEAREREMELWHERDQEGDASVTEEGGEGGGGEDGEEEEM